VTRPCNLYILATKTSVTSGEVESNKSHCQIGSVIYSLTTFILHRAVILTVWY